MQIFHAIILGAVEGVTEFLPVSSTGHLIISSTLLGLPSSEFLKSFEIAIQLGAIAAVALVYRKTLLAGPAVWTRIAVAFAPTAIIGLALHSVVKKYLLGDVNVVLWSLFLGGIALIIFERFHHERAGDAADIRTITHRQAFLIGVAQSVAIVPGVSRSAATILGGLALGVKRTTIVEFSFLLAVPTMVAATGLDLLKSAGEFSSQDAFALAVGGVVAFGVAHISIRFLLDYVRRHHFTAFGIYRIAAALIFFMILRP